MLNREWGSIARCTVAHDTRLGERCGAWAPPSYETDRRWSLGSLGRLASCQARGVFRTSAIAGGACSRLIAGQPEGVLGYGQIAGGSRCVRMRQTARSHQSASPGNRPAAGEGRLSGKAPCLATHSTSIETITRSSQRSTKELYRSHRSCIQHRPELIAIVPCRPLFPHAAPAGRPAAQSAPLNLLTLLEVKSRCRSATRSQALIQSCRPAGKKKPYQPSVSNRVICQPPTSWLLTPAHVRSLMRMLWGLGGLFSDLAWGVRAMPQFARRPGSISSTSSPTSLSCLNAECSSWSE